MSSMATFLLPAALPSANGAFLAAPPAAFFPYLECGEKNSALSVSINTYRNTPHPSTANTRSENEKTRK
jgi:hypothetical protein|tara:strand:+ start:3927 stop:4133 length:207 start_codon:yes stop_codon:yes gene_type:complete